MNELVSVVIPTHNRADLLPRAIDSVLNQTYSNFEIIVVSDGSTDNTEEVVKSYSDKDSRIRFIGYSPARGGNIARNTGIEAAKGEYVAFLDDDDEWMPAKLEKQINVMESDNRIGLVYTGVNIIYVNEGLRYSFIGESKGDLSKEILLDNHIGTTSTVMVRKMILEETGAFDEKLKALQDFELWIRVCQKCLIGLVPEELINYYNYTGTNQVSSSTQKYIDAFSYINTKHKSLLNELTTNQMSIKKMNECMLLANKAMRNGDSKLTRKYCVQALKYGLCKSALVYWVLSFTSFKTVLKIRSMK